MTPLPNADNDIRRVRYNRHHRATRQAIECAYGILKKRFPCLQHLRLNPTFAAKVIMACTTIHNLASQEDFEVTPQDLQPNRPNNAPNIAPNTRQLELINYFA